jgi:hypothetical protein
MADQQLGYWFGTGMVKAIIPKPEHLKTEALRQPVAAFATTSENALEISDFPMSMFAAGQSFKLAELSAYMQMFGNIQPTNPPMVSGKPLIELKALAQRFFWGELQSPLDVFNIGFSVKDLTGVAGARFCRAFDAMMSSELVLFWTAFETLAGDLWEAAVNAHPETLAQMSANNRQLPGEKQERKSVTIDALAKHRYDIKNKMGTILRASRGNFQLLDGIANIYTSTFPDQYDAGKPEVWREIDIKSPAAVRNVIVHKSGLADKMFLDQVSGDSRFASQQLGKKVELNGSLLNALINGLCSFAVRLIHSVDSYLDDNRT